MSRGYFARVRAIRTIVNKFLQKFRDEQCQIINLGAGYDTLYFNLHDSNQLPSKYVEIDFARIISSKIRLIKSKKILADKLKKSEEKDLKASTPQGNSSSPNESKPSLFAMPLVPPLLAPPLHAQPSTEMHTPNYDLISVDIRCVSELDKKLKECHIDFNSPTLVISECVLVYMSTEHSNNLLKYLSKTFKKCCFLNYEQVNLADRFGEIMLSNMEARSCKLLGVEACDSIESQINRFNSNNLNICQLITLTDYYNNKMNKNERRRIESLEFLDEGELLMQLLDHYCVCVASNSLDLFKSITFDE
jgi:[phosphatase 2A protein]-leucine-carboxy methyltransferase